jgi:hypothetical protein
MCKTKIETERTQHVKHSKHYIHECIGFGFSGNPYAKSHARHFWLCWRPACEAGDEYACGFLADALWRTHKVGTF